MQIAEVRPPYIKFERRAIEDRAATVRDKQYRAKDVDFALITPIGSKDVIVRVADEYIVNLEQQAREGRIPETWPSRFREALAAWRNGQEVPLHGTPIKGWSVLSPAQQANIVGANVFTVEDLAQANDEARRRIGMGSNELVEKAIAYIKAASGPSASVNEISALKAENRTLQAQIDELATTVKLLRAESEMAARAEPVAAP